MSCTAGVVAKTESPLCELSFCPVAAGVKGLHDEEGYRLFEIIQVLTNL